MSAELAALVGSFIASAFALVKYAMNQNRSILDRFVQFLQQTTDRQERVNEQFQRAMDQLGANVRENSILLARVAERLELS
jgi:hypothetical protein